MDIEDWGTANFMLPEGKLSIMIGDDLTGWFHPIEGGTGSRRLLGTFAGLPRGHPT